MAKELKKKDYKNIADCIISGQVPSDEIVWYFNDKKFDQHIFYLNSDSLGKYNDLQLKFYNNSK